MRCWPVAMGSCSWASAMPAASRLDRSTTRGVSRIDQHRSSRTAAVPLLANTRLRRSAPRDFPSDPDRQLQGLAQGDQICVPWPCTTLLPKIDSCGAHTHAVSNIDNRQSTFDPSIAEMTVKTNFSGQFYNPVCCWVVVDSSGFIQHQCEIGKRQRGLGNASIWNPASEGG